MANKIKVIPSNVKDLLNSISERFGIEVIEDYIKLYKRKKRKEMKRHNTKEEVAYDVYRLMFNEKYDKTRAKEKIASKRHLSDNTVRNHLYNFDKEAKKNNFYTLGWLIDELNKNSDINGMIWCKNGSFYSYEAKEDLAKLNNLEEEILNAYYWKYKTLPKKEKSKYQLNFKDIQIPDYLYCLIAKEYLPQKETIIKDKKAKCK